MDPNWHNRKCRDCAFRVKDVDPNNIGFKGNSYCRWGPPNLTFATVMTPNGVQVQPYGSNYTFVGEDTFACSHFEFNQGDVKRNIVKTVAVPNAAAPNTKLS